MTNAKVQECLNFREIIIWAMHLPSSHIRSCGRLLSLLTLERLHRTDASNQSIASPKMHTFSCLRMMNLWLTPARHIQYDSATVIYNEPRFPNFARTLYRAMLTLHRGTSSHALIFSFLQAKMYLLFDFFSHAWLPQEELAARLREVKFACDTPRANHHLARIRCPRPGTGYMGYGLAASIGYRIRN